MSTACRIQEASFRRLGGLRNTTGARMTTLGASLVLVVVCAGGCGATTRMHVSNPGVDSWPVPSSSEEVLTFSEGEAVDRNYRVIGKAFVFREKGQRFASSTSEEALTAILREQAAARGADAIIRIHSSDIARALSANVRETRSTQRIRVGRRQRKRTCWDCEREWKRMVVPLESGRPSEARQLLRTRR